MKFRKIILLILIFFLCNALAYAQFPLNYKQSVASIQADSVDIQYYKNKNWVTAAGQVVGLNIGVWAFDRYALNGDFAHIGWQSIQENFRHGFVWDNDKMSTNFFSHPYHGSLYYNSARANGFNMWQSTAFVMLGSATWELFMENEYPSINDAINTTLGGVIAGEVAYRTSDCLLDDRARGISRFGREFTAFLISPARGITRIINGDAWRIRQTSGQQFGSPNVNVEFSLGARNIELRDEIFDEGFGLAADVALEYGERFETDGWKPYDYFTVSGSISLQKKQPFLSKVTISGRLYGTDLIDSKKDYLNFGIYQHFNYYNSDSISDISNSVPYRFGTPSCFGIGLMYNNKRYENWHFSSYFHLNAVILGATLSDHYFVDERNYNMSNGFGIQLGFSFAYKDKVHLSYYSDSFYMFIANGYPEEYNLTNENGKHISYKGDTSTSVSNSGSLKLDVKLSKNLFITAETSSFVRSTKYKFYDDVYSLTLENKLMLTLKF
ncbi:MAG: DUF3943 domain-containing protein [Paludibacter sp.]|jgi:hypothetical protein|nr:DUF3943 domain-containing protein [Paludibacter sp.]